MYRKFYEALLSHAGGSWFDFEGLIRDIYVAVLRPGDVAIDAGAHNGDHTFQMAAAVAPNGRVVAIEAAPEMVKRLFTLLQTGYSQLSGIVEIRQIALSNCGGRAKFYYSPDAPGLSGLRKRSELPSGRLVEFEVELVSLDSMCQSIPRPIRFMKIDIEGGEFDALRGGAETILQDRPGIVFEHDAESPRYFLYQVEDLVGFLRSMDYHIFDFFGNSYDEIEPWRGTMMWNFVALPEGYENTPAVFGAVRRTLSAQFPAMLA